MNYTIKIVWKRCASIVNVYQNKKLKNWQMRKRVIQLHKE